LTGFAIYQVVKYSAIEQRKKKYLEEKLLLEGIVKPQEKRPPPGSDWHPMSEIEQRMK
jgi:hypothetical protein